MYVYVHDVLLYVAKPHTLVIYRRCPEAFVHRMTCFGGAQCGHRSQLSCSELASDDGVVVGISIGKTKNSGMHACMSTMFLAGWAELFNKQAGMLAQQRKL